MSDLKVLVLVNSKSEKEFKINMLPNQENVDYHVLSVKDHKSFTYVIEEMRELFFHGIIFEGFHSEDGLVLFSLCASLIRNMAIGENTPCDVPIALMLDSEIEFSETLPASVFCMYSYEEYIIDQLLMYNMLSEKSYRTGFMPGTQVTLQDRPGSILLQIISNGDPRIVWVNKTNEIVLNFVGDVIVDLAQYVTTPQE